ncbi:MAG TPA: ABC-2 family transporter protein [Chloroflexota bacterium]|nr:ABC-2 family transporter protein [Chloroflexota bacterium]
MIQIRQGRAGGRYRAIFRTCLAESLTYRSQNAVWVVQGVLPPLFAIIAWLAIYGGRQQVGSFTRSDMITYYLVISVAWYVIGGRINNQIARAIKDGSLAHQLLKPYAALAPQVLGEQCWKLVSLVLALPLYLVLVLYFHHDLHLALSLPRLALALASMVLSATIFIILEVILGSLAFWTTDTRNLFEVYDLLLVLASGELAPISLFPGWLGDVLNGLPFRYTFSFPVEVFLGKLGPTQTALGLLVQLGWLAALCGLARLLWIRGLRRYSAAGM